VSFLLFLLLDKLGTKEYNGKLETYKKFCILKVVWVNNLEIESVYIKDWRGI